MMSLKPGIRGQPNGRPNRAGRKLNQIESGSHVEGSVEFLPPPRR